LGDFDYSASPKFGGRGAGWGLAGLGPLNPPSLGDFDYSISPKFGGRGAGFWPPKSPKVGGL